MKSRAAVMVGDKTFEVRELPVPDAPPGGAILRVTANGLCGSDYDSFVGRLGPMRVHVPGHEPVGQIVSIDPQAAARWNVEVGDRVAVEHRVKCGMCRECRRGRHHHCLFYGDVTHGPRAKSNGDVALYGGMAEYMVLRAGIPMVKIPDHLSDLDASLFNALGNAMHWTRTIGRVGLGDKVLVLGPGQRGTFSAMVAHEAGAEMIIVTGRGSDAHKMALLKDFGATHVINVDEEDTVERVREITRGEGVDLAIDSTPGAVDPPLHALQVLRPQGTLVIGAVKATAIPIPSDRLMMGELRVKGAAGLSGRGLEETVRLLASGNYPFAKMQTHQFGLNAVEQAIRILGGEVAGEEPIHVTILPDL